MYSKLIFLAYPSQKSENFNRCFEKLRLSLFEFFFEKFNNISLNFTHDGSSQLGMHSILEINKIF